MTLAVLFGGAVFRLALGWPRHTASFLRLLRVAALLAAISGVGWAAATIAGIAGAFPDIFDPALLQAFFLDSPFGPIILARLALLAMNVVVTSAPMREGARLAAVAWLTGLLLVSQGWLGHAAAGGASPAGAAMLAAYACHVLAAAAWVGGLPPLLLALRETHGDDGDAARLLRRVSNLATAIVAVLVAAGTVNASFRIAAVSELVTTAYGNVLSVKLALTAAMLALAAYNRRVAATGHRLARLTPSVAGELILGVLVLGAAAVLGITPPPS